MGHLATPEKHGDLNFVIVRKKADRLLHFEVDVVLSRLGTYTNFFELRLVSLVLGGPFALVVFELTEVHNSTNRRLGFRSDFNEIKPLFLSFLECFCGRDNS